MFLDAELSAKVALATVPTPEELLERVESILPMIRDRVPETSKRNSLPEETVADIKAAGLHHIQQPLRFGGYGYGQIPFVDVVEKIAAECGSSAWVYAVLGAHQRLLAFYPEEVQKAVWGDAPDHVASSAFAPSGAASRVRGGYRLSGRWPYSSGCDFAQWAMIGGKVDGELRPMSFVVPMEHLQILDDWDVMGLNATGSKTLVGQDIFVPDAFAQPNTFFEGTTGPAGLVSVAIGIARGAIESFVKLYGDKVQPIRGGRFLESEALQSKLARSMADVDAASLLIHRDIMSTEAVLQRQDSIPLEIQSRNRRDQAYAGQLAMKAVERLFAEAGATATANSNPLQIKYRDVRAASLHATVNWDLAARQSIRMLYDPTFRPTF